MLTKLVFLALLNFSVKTNSNHTTYKPVCGANNVTYQNQYQCNQANVQVAHTGSCNTNAYNVRQGPQGGRVWNWNNWDWQHTNNQQAHAQKHAHQQQQNTAQQATNLKPFLLRQSEVSPQHDFSDLYEQQRLNNQNRANQEVSNAIKVTSEGVEGNWNWEHGVHQSLNDFDYDTKGSRSPFEWATARTNGWDSVANWNTTAYEIPKQHNDWKTVSADAWGPEYDWETVSGNGVETVTLEQPEEQQDNGSWQLNSDVNADNSWWNNDALEGDMNVGATMVGVSN